MGVKSVLQKLITHLRDEKYCKNESVNYICMGFKVRMNTTCPCILCVFHVLRTLAELPLILK